MDHPTFFTPDNPALNYVVTHVFLPVQVPKKNDCTVKNDLSLACAARIAVDTYSAHIDGALKPRWHSIEKMLDNLQASVQSGVLRKSDIVLQLRSMRSGDILAFYIGVQRAAVIFRKQDDHTLYESFEVASSRDVLLYTPGSISCTYPRSSIQVPNDVFDDVHFQTELAHFLSRPGEIGSDLPSVPASQSQYITALLNGILRSVGRTIDSPRIQKHVRDEIGQSERKEDEWRRSSLWLLIRVAIQTSLDRSHLGRICYKQFLLFFICGLAKDANNAGLSGDLLHLMSCKILRRLSKLGSSVPDWLSDMALKTCTCLQDTLEVRTTEIRASQPQPSYWNPSELDLVNDTRLSLSHSDEYIRSALENHVRKPRSTFSPVPSYVRGTLADFLSDPTLFDEAYSADPYVALYDVEQSVEESIDDWVAHVTDVGEASTQLGRLMEIYLSSASIPYVDNPEYRSIAVLTALELWVALDKLVVTEIPILADYSPEIPIWLLESLLLRKGMNLHRLSRVYQYLSARHSRSRSGLSVLSDEFTQDSFPVRFYDCSPVLQSFKAPFGEGLMSEFAEGGEFADGEAPCPDLTLRNGADVLKSQLFISPLVVKVIAFELQCPLPLHIWRSCTGHLLYRFDNAKIKPFLIEYRSASHDFLFDIPELRPFLVQHLHRELPVHSQFQPAYIHLQGLGSRRSPRLIYAFRWRLPRYEHSRWHGIGDGPLSQHTTYYNYFADGCGEHGFNDHRARIKGLKVLATYISNTTHTSNEVLAAQTNCPLEFSLDEFISLGHVRDGSSLQWLNILRELRGRTLNFRSHEVYFLLAQAVCQVGPLDVDTGEWIWHQELQDPSFCNALLTELESLFLDVAAGSLDHVTMLTISLLLTRLLPSSPYESVSERVVQLLRDVRWKTLEWVQELAYNLILAPTQAERCQSLYDMAATCRSTFDVDVFALHKLSFSAQDVDALFSCALFIRATRTKSYQRPKLPNCASCYSSVSDILDYSELHRQRDCRLSIAIEVVLKDVILADVSDRGIDLAIRSVWPGYRPSPKRWESDQHCWPHVIVCTTATTVDRGSQLMHVNLLDESLLVNNRPLGELPPEVRGHPLYKELLDGQALVITPSDLPGMDFATLAIISAHRLHFSLRNRDLVIRAQHQNTNAVLELIPSEKLNGDLPVPLVQGHVHWLKLSELLIEIRPLKHLWKQSSENWQIVIGTGGGYRALKGLHSLVDIKSRTWSMISSRLDCLCPAGGPVITTSTATSGISPSMQLSVTIHHHGLSFFVNAENGLESNDFKGMIYDDNQCIGTLFGVMDRVVLRAKDRVEDGLVPRRVLVPIYAFQHRSPNTKKNVWGTDDITCYSYTVDAELGCLIGDSGLESRMFLAYLHAETSIDWQPDPLTGTTGCQEALSIIHSAGTQPSSIPLSESLLVNIYSQYPQLNLASSGLYDLSDIDDPLSVTYPQKRHITRQIRGAKRAAHLFQPNSTTPLLPGNYRDSDKSSVFFELELEDTVYTAASALFHLQINVQIMDIVLKWTGTWSDVMRKTINHLPSPYDGVTWNSNLPEALLTKVQELLRQENDGTRCKFQVLFLLPNVAYCSSHPQAAFLSMFLTLAKDKQHPWGNPLFYADYRLLDGYSPTDKVLRYLIHASRHKDQPWDAEMEGIIEGSVECLLRAWPSDTIPTLRLFLSRLRPSLIPASIIWDMEYMTCTLQTVFLSCYGNLKLKDELSRVLRQPANDVAFPARSLITSIQATFSSHQGNYSPSSISPSCTPSSLQNMPGSGSWSVKLDQLFFSRPAPKLPELRRFATYSFYCDIYSSSGHLALDGLYSFLRTNKTDLPFREQYINNLDISAQRVRAECRTRVGTQNYAIERLKEHFQGCRAKCSEALRILKESLSPMANPLEQALSRSGQRPTITAVSLSRCLATTSPIKLSRGWKRCLVSYVLLLLELQRSRRLLLFALKDLEEEFSMELENEGCDGWHAEEFPDWLLIQLQGNFLIRRTQANIAMEMMSPRSGRSTVMQVNMGEGKSSVIIPIVAAALADGHQLVRVVVPKTLVEQMFDILVNRLSGLVNRTIYQWSYSRQNATYCYDWSRCDTMSGCMKEHHIVVTQPEDILSLRVKSVEMQLPPHKLVAKPSSRPQSIYDCSVAVTGRQVEASNADSYLANLLRGLRMVTTRKVSRDENKPDHTIPEEIRRELLKLQKWHHSYTRDILDECDEILHPRFQLIYTVGHQQHMDGYPDRWSVAQRIMRLVKQSASSLAMDLPDSIEFKLSKPGSFPYFRILRTSDAGRRLILLLLHDVMSGCLPSFHFQHLSQTRRDAIQHFLSSEDADLQLDTAKEVEEYAKQSQQSNLWGGLLLLRGLFACNILLFALTERRWRVDYGLISDHWVDLNGGERPTMLAVPYRAKDVPAPYTQFGHPDVTILLTCLSYYYTGLSMAQLRICFQILQDEDNLGAEYASWVEDCDSGSLPHTLHCLGEFNLESSEEWDKYLYPTFYCNQAAIDFYLSRVVFPKEAKEFPWKLAGSSWDIAEKKERPITGFSGTNDNRYLLPLSITQHDLDHQQGTNARVLGYLLQPENDSYALITHEDNELSKTREFLNTVVNQTPEIRVVLDVGAQILDVSNEELAEEWLGLTGPGIAGAIYFDDKEGKLMILTRTRTSVPLVASPLSQQLERCVIYLDDARTRGTDLKFPKGFRAAVTLGPKVTKDRLVQGCMRMRKLGHGHSVMFFAPLEVDLSIRSVAHKEDAKIPITATDILRWAIHETWTDIQERAPHWAQQGMSHQRRYEAWSRYCRDELEPDQLADVWLERDAKSLTDLYASHEARNTSETLSPLETYISRRCNDLGASKPSNRRQLDEQLEREVSREIEREREVELPPKAEPAGHFLHPDVVSFVKTGALRSSGAFLPVFTALEQSSAAAGEAPVGWSPFVLATVDFCRIIKEIPPGGRMDQYLRPVQWVISGRKDRDRVLVIVSPFEAHHLMPDIRVSNHIHLHVYVPRTSERMKPADDLMFYSIPPVPDDWTPPWDLIDQLNIFAGQLYLRDYDSYLRLSRFLQIQKQSREDRMKKAIRYNLFNLRSHQELEKADPDSLLPCMMMLLAMRRRGLPFSESHMGRILQGQSLTREDFKSATTTRVDDEETDSEYDIGSRSASPLGSDIMMDCNEDSVPRRFSEVDMSNVVPFF